MRQVGGCALKVVQNDAKVDIEVHFYSKNDSKVDISVYLCDENYVMKTFFCTGVNNLY
jgi:hypothetical protein